MMTSKKRSKTTKQQYANFMNEPKFAYCKTGIFLNNANPMKHQCGISSFETILIRTVCYEFILN